MDVPVCVPSLVSGLEQSSPGTKMLASLKRNLKTRLLAHVDREVHTAVRDIELARQRSATKQSAEFVDKYMKMAGSYPDKFALLKAALAHVKVQGLFCEFGVYSGTTINFIASQTANEVHGFDSFEGLPEDWRAGHEKGKFKLQSLPTVRPNVRLHKGLFEHTIPPFRDKYRGPLAFVHFDADLYSSTRTIFDMLGDCIVPGTVMQFDEFFNHPNWVEGEYKAFSEFCAAHEVVVNFLGFTHSDEQVAMKVLQRVAPKASL